MTGRKVLLEYQVQAQHRSRQGILRRRQHRIRPWTPLLSPPQPQHQTQAYIQLIPPLFTQQRIQPSSQPLSPLQTQHQTQAYNQLIPPLFIRQRIQPSSQLLSPLQTQHQTQVCNQLISPLFTQHQIQVCNHQRCRPLHLLLRLRLQQAYPRKTQHNFLQCLQPPVRRVSPLPHKLGYSPHSG